MCFYWGSSRGLVHFYAWCIIWKPSTDDIHALNTPACCTSFIVTMNITKLFISAWFQLLYLSMLLEIPYPKQIPEYGVKSVTKLILLYQN